MATGVGKQPTFRTVRAQRTVCPQKPNQERPGLSVWTVPNHLQTTHSRSVSCNVEELQPPPPFGSPAEHSDGPVGPRLVSFEVFNCCPQPLKGGIVATAAFNRFVEFTMRGTGQQQRNPKQCADLIFNRKGGGVHLGSIQVRKFGQGKTLEQTDIQRIHAS